MLYQHSLVPVREIARLAGLTERNVYATVRRRGCAPRVHGGPGLGRRIVAPADEAAPAPLDIAAARQAIAACAKARERALDAAAARAAARRQRTARRQAFRDAEIEARSLSAVAGALQRLAVAAGGAKTRRSKANNKRRHEQGYVGASGLWMTKW
jgi:hypothetical protein